ncbi:MAG TPA: sialidase family protein [Actinomycetota bacterium]|nr:sialidase family protein [Actinomycetota bacterium]
MRKVRNAVALAIAIALVLPAITSAAGSDPSGRVERRTIDAVRSRIAPRSATIEELGTLTGRELKAWARRFVEVGADARFVPSQIECTTDPADATGDFRLDCDTLLPNNEPDVEVNPNDPDHIIASSNDYDWCCDGFYTTLDGGQTWEQGNMSVEDPSRIGSDPVTVFEPRTGNILHTSLNFQITRNGLGRDGDLVVSISRDGGFTWGKPIVIYDGQGTDIAPRQVFNDKEWIVVDTNPSSPFYGRAYVTWSRFLSRNASYAESPIWESHSDDGGRTWSEAQEISGSAEFCDIQYHGRANECDENQFSVPTVAPDGTVYVAFQNEQNSEIQEPGEGFGNRDQIHDNQYLVVQSHDGGVTWSAPVIAATLEDGPNDYPISSQDRQTLTGYDARVNSAGNIIADDDGDLYVVFSDNRNGTPDRREPVTNTDVFMVRSTDGGASWGPVTGVDTSPGDQWFPWVDADPTSGELAVVYHSRNEPNPDLYNTFVARGNTAVDFTYIQVSSQPSDPTHSVFFKAGVKGCHACATFIGDYNRLAYGPDGRIHAAWTDMRRRYHGAEAPRFLQFVFYAQLP